MQANQNQAKGKGKKTTATRRGMPSFKERICSLSNHRALAALLPQEWSVQTRPEWSLMREIMLTSLAPRLRLDQRHVQVEATRDCLLLVSEAKLQIDAKACDLCALAWQSLTSVHSRLAVQLVEFEDVHWAGNLPTYCKAFQPCWLEIHAVLHNTGSVVSSKDIQGLSATS